MEMPVRFYCYRYQDFWEAELPVGWEVRRNGNNISLAANNLGGEFLSVWTISQADVGKNKDAVNPITAKDWRFVCAFFDRLDEEDEAREPELECGLWNNDFEAWFRIRSWRFRGEDFLVTVMYHTKAKHIDPVHDSIVDRFVNTLKLVNV